MACQTGSCEVIDATFFFDLRQFVADGGTLISLGEASNLLVDKLPRG
jgi:hypothetical protein